MYFIVLTFTISCAALALVYLWRIANWLWFKPRYLEKRLRQQGFNGNSYKFFYGDFKESSTLRKEARSKPMAFSNEIVPRVVPSFHKALTKYGEKCFVWFGPIPAIPILDPEIIREIMSKNHEFPKPSGKPFTRLLAAGLASLEAEKWAKHRKLINPAFHLDKLKVKISSKNSYPSIPIEEWDGGTYGSIIPLELLRKWDDILAKKGGGSSEVDVWPFLQTLTSDVISRTAFGSCYMEGRRIFELQKVQASHIMEANRSVHIPGYRFLPTRFNRRMKETGREIESTLVRIMSKRMKAMEEGASHNDLRGIMLDSNWKEIKQHGKESGMSLKEVIEECKLFYFAGQETTASLLLWTMILLSKHQDWQVRARNEVLQLLGPDKPDYQELNHLKIVSMIFHEVLRLYPAAAILTRNNEKERRLGEARIPEGVQLIMPLIMSHHDRRFWGEEAEEFKPERFGEGAAGKKAYFPFGWICIGLNFAMLEAKMAMAMILQNYSFELSPSYAHAPHTVLTLQPQHGAHLILTKL